MKRTRSNNTNHLACNGTLQVLFTGGADFVVRQVGAPCDFEDGITTDSVDLVIHFRGGGGAGGGGTLMLQYVGAEHVQSPLLWTQALLPLADGVPLTLREQELEYRCFPSYVAHVKNNGTVISSVYLSIDNVKTANDGFDLSLQVHVNTRLQFMSEHLGDRGRFLDWFPPDVDPAQWGLRVDPRRIPQRTPLWFKLRGDVSGSKAYVLLGWFSDNKPMSAFQKSAMRLGTHSEDAIVLMYCHTFPDRTFEEVGWCPAPGHPIGWGASPDGIVTDPSMTWDQVPDPAIREGYGNVVSITHGACEFKTSRTKLVVEPYFLAQIYMEMIALQVVWCDLVRYRPSRDWDPVAGQWRYNDEAHVYRIFRYPAMEQRLVPLWKRAHANQHILVQKIIHEEEFVAVRADLEQVARTQEPYRKITMTPQLQSLLNAYEAYRNPRTTAPVPVVEREKEEEDDDPIWMTMAARHLDIKRSKRDGAAAFVQLIAQQIKDYASLLYFLMAFPTICVRFTSS